MSLKVKIKDFEGPFDVLLHLIRKNKMDIYNIKLYEITTQYLEYIKTLEEMDLEVTSEFIITAATMIEIKSRALLPKEKNDEEDADDIDPSKELINKLIQYNKFKAAALYLKEKEKNSEIVYSKKGEIIEDTHEVSTEELLKGVTMLKLFKIYEEVLNSYYNKQNINVIEREIPIDSFKIEDKIDKIRKVISNKDMVAFSEIVFESVSKMEVVVTFLALLELAKLREPQLLQSENFQDIIIERINANEKL